ncbi:hypothetical protein HZA71_00060, partial [Candidatus Falkowbacteria bacterium]|nr:hypothetical protein [Candidatus Falkowbacteria bacterium]
MKKPKSAVEVITAKEEDKKAEETTSEANKEENEPLAEASAAETTQNNGSKEAVQKEIEEIEAAETELPESKLPFPRATIVNMLRKNLAKGKHIKGQVKDELNLWLAKMIERLGAKMNAQPYTFASYEMLKESIAPFEFIQDVETEKTELAQKLQGIKDGCDSIINYLDETSKKKVKAISMEGEEPPFPKATITRSLRKHLDAGKHIKGPVKQGLNIWLGKLVQRIAKKMDSHP